MRVCNFKEIPLGVSVSIDIVLKEHIILIIRNFDSSKEVATLEPGLELQSLIVITGGVIIGERSRRRILMTLDDAACFHLYNVVALDVVVLDQLLNVYQISSSFG